jgi:hypothetical protein
MAIRLTTLILLLGVSAAFSQTYTTVLNNGPSSNRVDIVFIGDGYTAADHTAGTYNTHVNNYMNYMFTNSLSEPFVRYNKFFNAHAIRVDSAQSGCDEPQNGITKNTALDATYRFDGVTDRLLYFSNSKANAAMTTALSGSGITADMRYGIVNNSIYGGGGGTWAVYAGGNTSAREVALHEVGHSFSNLADEYGGITTPYTGPEPTEVNVTTDPTGAKWARWLGYNQPGIGVIGAYNGGRYHDSGIYRPSNNSKMRTLGVNFDAISREKIILDIYSKVNPLDSFTSNSTTLNNPISVSVTPIDDNVIDFQWFVDGVLVPSQTSTTFTFGVYTPGTHQLRVRAYDPTGFDPVNGWVRMNQSELEQIVTWNFTVVPEPALFGLFGVSLGLFVRKGQFLV